MSALQLETVTEAQVYVIVIVDLKAPLVSDLDVRWEQVTQTSAAGMEDA
jgi:hypothetical protein